MIHKTSDIITFNNDACLEECHGMAESRPL